MGLAFFWCIDFDMSPLSKIFALEILGSTFIKLRKLYQYCFDFDKIYIFSIAI